MSEQRKGDRVGVANRRAQMMVALGVVLAAIGVLSASWRPVLLGAGLLAWLGWDYLRAPTAPVRYERAAVAAVTRQHEISFDVRARGSVGAQACWLHASAPGRRSVDVVLALPQGAERVVPVTTTVFRAGRQDLVEMELQTWGPLGVVREEIASFPLTRTVVLPRVYELKGLPLPMRLAGLAGTHPSRRVGVTGDLRDIAPFTPGDRLRRIDWRATARLSTGRSELLVRRTDATADGTVILMIDSRDDISPRPETWSGAGQLAPQDITSLDISREAAASLAARYLASGDRVGAHDLGGFSAPMVPRGGRGQLERLRLWLALAAPVGDPTDRVRPPQVPSGCLVVMLSTFLDDVSARVASAYHAAGHRTVAIDVMPPVHDMDVTAGRAIAVRVQLLDRQDRIDRLRRQGVETVTWRTSGPEPIWQATMELTSMARPGRPWGSAA